MGSCRCKSKKWLPSRNDVSCSVSPIQAVVNSSGDILASSQKFENNDTIHLWGSNKIKVIDEEENRTIMNQAENLITESKLEINIQKLKDLMRDITGEENANELATHFKWTDRAALLANSASFKVPDTVREMFLQQSVYIPISNLFYAIGQALKCRDLSSKYKADQHVHCFPLVEGKNIKKNKVPSTALNLNLTQQLHLIKIIMLLR